MRIFSLFFLTLMIYSCKTGENISHVENDCGNTEKNYEVDTLKSLNEYVAILSERKLNCKHHYYVIITDVNLVDVRNSQIVPNRTIIIHDNIIFKIQSSEEKLPDVPKENGALIINGNGRYIAPGLCDMHVHYLCGAKDRLNYLLYGVTTIRNAFGFPIHKAEQDLLKANEIIGPNLYSTGPSFQYSEKSDSLFLKDSVINNLTWLYINKFDNQDEIIKSLAFSQKTGIPASIDIHSYLPEINYPEGTIFEQYTGIKYLFQSPDIKSYWFLSKLSLSSNSRNLLFDNGDTEKIKTLELVRIFLKKNSDRFCIGTESGANSGSLPGYSLHHEMKFLQSEKLNPAEILRKATLNAGIMVDITNSFINKNKTIDSDYSYKFGEIKEGYRADIVILENNPLENVNYYGEIHSVFINGIYLSPEDLIEIREALSKLHQ